MEKEFVNYDLSLRMKQLGYKKEGVDEDCFAFYDEEEYLFTVREQDDIDEEWLIAPTFSQAFRWFREKYNLLNEIVFYRDDLRIKRAYWFTIFKWDEKMTSREFVRANNNLFYLTYEEAELACLEKLIEIVEQKEK